MSAILCGSGRSARAAGPVPDSVLRWEPAPHSAVRRAVWCGAELFLCGIPSAAEPLGPYLSVLPPEERDRAELFHDEACRTEYIAGRALLRRLLGERLRTDPRGMEFEYSQRGKPSLGGEHAASGLRFSLSHSGGKLLVGITRGTGIGVDIERFDPVFNPEPIVSRFFPEHERERLSRMRPQAAREEFFRLWVHAEAEGKRTGHGVLPALKDLRPYGADRCGAGRHGVKDTGAESGCAVYTGRYGQYCIGIAVGVDL